MLRFVVYIWNSADPAAVLDASAMKARANNIADMRCVSECEGIAVYLADGLSAPDGVHRLHDGGVILGVLFEKDQRVHADTTGSARRVPNCATGLRGHTADF